MKTDGARKKWLVLCLVLACCAGWGADDAPPVGIPLRVPRVRAGDWIIFLRDDVYVRHTATRIEETVEDRVVHYLVEEIAADRTLLDRREESYSRREEEAAARELEKQFALLGVTGERREIAVADKPLNIVVFKLPEPLDTEMWLTDEAGILGTVKFFRPDGGDGEEIDMDIIGFGGAQ